MTYLLSLLTSLLKHILEAHNQSCLLFVVVVVVVVVVVGCYRRLQMDQIHQMDLHAIVSLALHKQLT